MISDATKAEILDKIDIVELVGEVVTLKKAGSIFKGLCPFHDEKSPSFTVSPVRRTYHCFGCGVHGDAIRFVMEQNALTFPEALRHLGEKAGVRIPETRRESPQQRAARQKKKTEAERLGQVQHQLCEYYTRALFGPAGGRARRYLMQRGISVEAARAFRLGYADGNKQRFAEFMQLNDIHPNEMIALGVLVIPPDRADRKALLGGGYLRFRDRLMFPVVDLRGTVTGFSARLLDPNAKAAKYLNSPETPLFTKGEQLYGAHTARAEGRKKGRIVLCEGNVDVIAMWQAGLPNTVAAMGTALTPQQVRLVKRLSDNVVCVMDGDAAGAKAAFASLQPFLEAGVQPRAVMLPDGEDPDSFLASEGAATLNAMLDDARPLLDLFIDRTAERHPADPPGRVAALRAIAPALAELRDELTERLYRDQVSRRLELPTDVVTEAVARARATHQANQSAPTPAAPAAPWAGPPEPDWTQAPPVWDDGPPPEPPPPDGPPPGMMDPDSSFAGLTPLPRAGGALTPGSIPRHEDELCELIAEYPEFAPRVEAAGAFKFLTRPGLADFLVRLCRRVSSGAPFHEDRLLREYEKVDTSVVAFWRERQTRRSGLDPQGVSKAFDVALVRIEQGWILRERKRISARLRTFKSLSASPEAIVLMKQFNEHGRRLKQLAMTLEQADVSHVEGVQ